MRFSVGFALVAALVSSPTWAESVKTSAPKPKAGPVQSKNIAVDYNSIRDARKVVEEKAATLVELGNADKIDMEAYERGRNLYEKCRRIYNNALTDLASFSVSLTSYGSRENQADRNRVMQTTFVEVGTNWSDFVSYVDKLSSESAENPALTAGNEALRSITGKFIAVYAVERPIIQKRLEDFKLSYLDSIKSDTRIVAKVASEIEQVEKWKGSLESAGASFIQASTKSIATVAEFKGKRLYADGATSFNKGIEVAVTDLSCREAAGKAADKYDSFEASREFLKLTEELAKVQPGVFPDKEQFGKTLDSICGYMQSFSPDGRKQLAERLASARIKPIDQISTNRTALDEERSPAHQKPEQ